MFSGSHQQLNISPFVQLAFSQPEAIVALLKSFASVQLVITGASEPPDFFSTLNSVNDNVAGGISAVAETPAGTSIIREKDFSTSHAFDETALEVGSVSRTISFVIENEVPNVTFSPHLLNPE